MRKKWIVMLLCGCLVLSGCGGKDEDDETVNNDNNNKGQSGSLLNPGNNNSNNNNVTPGVEGDQEGNDNPSGSQGAYWDPEGSVTLGKYLGVEVEKVSYEVTDEEIEAEIDYFLRSNSELLEVTDRNTVESGDVVKVDYTLSIDGEEIDSSEGEDVEVGGQYYDFEEELIGALVGESKTVEKQISDTYYSNYLGQTGTYIVNIKAIQTRVIPELTDETVASFMDYSTVEQYREGVFKELEQQKIEEAQDQQVSLMFDAIIADSTFTGISDADKQSYVDEMIEYYSSYATYLGFELKDFIDMYFNFSYEEFLELAQEEADFMVKQNLIQDAVAKAENLEVSDQEYTDYLANYAAENSFDSPEDAEKEFGKEAFLQVILRDKAYELLVDSMIIK